MIKLRVVNSAPQSEIADAAELALAAHCLRLHVTREQALLAALAEHVPDELLFQWRAQYYEAEFSRQWLEQLACLLTRKAAA